MVVFVGYVIVADECSRVIRVYLNVRGWVVIGFCDAVADGGAVF